VNLFELSRSTKTGSRAPVSARDSLASDFPTVTSIEFFAICELFGFTSLPKLNSQLEHSMHAPERQLAWPCKLKPPVRCQETSTCSDKRRANPHEAGSPAPGPMNQPGRQTQPPVSALKRADASFRMPAQHCMHDSTSTPPPERQQRSILALHTDLICSHAGLAAPAEVLPFETAQEAGTFGRRRDMAVQS